MNTYGDVATDEMAVASGKIAELALTDHKRITRPANLFKNWRRG